MAVRPTAVFLLLLLLTALLPGGGRSTSVSEFPLGLLPYSLGGCRGTIAECLGSGVELDLDTEVSRRMLATASDHISYKALDPNKVSCSQKGASYYNCQPGGETNPYNRNCNQIDRCRS